MPEGIQKTNERIRPPRVNMICEVEENGAMVKKELPFLTGVLADLSGDKRREKKLADRKFVAIDKDNFDDVLRGISPELKLEVANTLLGGDNNLKVQLKFNSLKDFSPAEVAKQVPALAKLMETRSKLVDLKGRADGRDVLEELLEKMLKDDAFRAKVSGALGEKPTDGKA